MRKVPLATAIRRAVLIALAPACGQPQQMGSDASLDVATSDTTLDVDNGDADAGIDDSATNIDVPYIGPPDGCIISGRPDAFAPCGWLEELSDPVVCQVDVNADGGVQQTSVCFALCAPTEPDCSYYQLGDAGYYLTCAPGCVGRLHEEARAFLSCQPNRDDVGDYLARAASLEEASVGAFRILARELEHHRAPAKLRRRACRAAHDEVRHTRVMTSLARRYGRVPVALAPPSPRRESRSLVAIAIENAEEGCIRETFGAAVAMWQAERATDPRVRTAMKRIARDECTHAKLAWQVHAWANERLTPSERLRVSEARRRAAVAMKRSMSGGSTDRASVGLPDHGEAQRLFSALSAVLGGSGALRNGTALLGG